jgi:hypothetical protein
MAQLEHIEVIEKRLWNAAAEVRANSKLKVSEHKANCGDEAL